MRFLMCRPQFYGIHYEINPWMNVNMLADHAAANQQWNNLYKTLQTCGAQIELVEPEAGWPDMTFTANAGLFYQEKIIISHFKYKERQGEATFFAEWFEKAGFILLNTISQKPPYFEGAGDALFAGKKLFAGFGFRTDRSFYETATYLNQQELIYCELVDPYFYHIDTCFCPINENLALWYPAAFSVETQKYMQQEIELIPVIESEAARFACNAVVVNDHIIVPDGTPELSKILKKRGYQVHACIVDEFIKAGGACKCLTMRIDA